ncbi:MAG: hypothetical protein ACXAEX_22770, partial [Promethearchaeota archaeon]
MNVSNQIPFPVANSLENRYLRLFPRTCLNTQAYNLARIPELVAGVEEVISMLEEENISDE